MSALRRHAYRIGLQAQEKLPVPVIVVGNITVGGTGKTPLVAHLARAIKAAGRRPGILSRGYKGGVAEAAQVDQNGDPARFGDEAVLLARTAECPVFVASKRAAAGRALLMAYRDCDVLIADDGMQHYALARDLEIAVFDARGVSNGWLLPAGPLREPISRLETVDAIVLNGNAELPVAILRAPIFRMRLIGEQFRCLGDPDRKCEVGDLVGKTLHAVAGIGAPDRFFGQLSLLGLEFIQHSFPDHHNFRREELDFVGDAILTTEKDAVKLTSLGLSIPVWVLPVVASIEPDLAAFVLEKLNGRALA